MGDVIVSPTPTQATHNSSLIVVVAVVPVDRDVTGLPVFAVLAVLSSIGDVMPPHSSMTRLVLVEEGIVRVTLWDSPAPATLKRILTKFAVAPNCACIARVQPGIDPPSVAAMPRDHAINKFPAVGVLT